MTKDLEGDDGTGSEMMAGDGPGLEGDDGTEAVAGDLPGLEINCIFSVAIVRLDEVVIGKAKEGPGGDDDDEVPVAIDGPGSRVAEVSGILFAVVIMMPVEGLNSGGVAIGEAGT